MGGCRCSYKNCKNTTKTTENVHFFHYPVKHKERCKLWIEYANKPQFCDLEEDQLRNKVICEYHFEDRWFPNSQKKRLLQGAVPTLDGDCSEEQAPETPLYLSSQLQDVQILPTNADRTIFVLDTDTMFGRSQKVESYIYKNGVIVPSNSKQVKPTFSHSKPSTSTSNNTVYCSFKDSSYEPITNSCRVYENEQANNLMEETPEYKVVIKKESPDYNEATILNKTAMEQNTLGRIGHVVEQEHFETPEPEQIYEMSNSTSAIQKRPPPRNVYTKNVVAKGGLDKSVRRNYLHKIKQHSRDIASIKRMLKQKTFAESKPDTNTILNSLQEHLPPSFFTILSLNLNNKCDLTDDDVDFFTSIHKTSPEVYQLLIDKYKWNLPCVDIVETPME